tara:strand:+ start:1473 stop:1916 length:444 start_codon:yes stop_codon:yes gene_type:complete
MNYKFNEDKLIQELMGYVDKTYDQHYATDKYQATDIIIDSGHGTGFCLGNVIKYAKRYGNKGTPIDARKDILKILHYALIQLDIHDQENKNRSENTDRDFGLGQTDVNYSFPEYKPQLAAGHYTGINNATPEEWDKAHRVKGAPLSG